MQITKYHCETQDQDERLVTIKTKAEAKQYEIQDQFQNAV